MAAPVGHINLFKSESSISPQLEGIQEQLRVIGYGAIGIFLLVGLVVGVTFVVMQAQYQSLTNSKTQLIERINRESQKEGLLVSLKDRIKVVDKAIASQKPWSSLLDTILPLIPPPRLTNIGVDDEDRITITVRLPSIEESMNIVTTMLQLAIEQKIRNPQLTGFSFDKDGGVRMSLSFLPLFTL